MRQPRKKPAERRLELFQSIWGDSWESFNIWNRKVESGFGTIPRSLPYINNILDELADHGKPLASTYLSLWCRNFDDGLLEIKNENVLANESSFFGIRADSTWRTRMRKLQELGFIEARKGLQSEFQYVILLNPFNVIFQLKSEEIYKDKESLIQKIDALSSRMMEVGAVWQR